MKHLVRFLLRHYELKPQQQVAEYIICPLQLLRVLGQPILHWCHHHFVFQIILLEHCSFELVLECFVQAPVMIQKWSFHFLIHVRSSRLCFQIDDGVKRALNGRQSILRVCKCFMLIIEIRRACWSLTTALELVIVHLVESEIIIG